MIEAIKTFLPYLAAASHALLAFLFLALIFRASWGRRAADFLGRHALLLGLAASLGAVLGSLFYSEIVGFEACVLCWWQRVFIYPQLVLFAIALWLRDRGVFLYSLALSILGGIIALYQSYVYWGGESILSCTSVGGGCSKVFVMELGYITIPSMSLTVFLYLILLYWANRLYTSDSSTS